MRTLIVLILLVSAGIDAPTFAASGPAMMAESNPAKDVGFLGIGLVNVDADRASVLKLGDQGGAEVVAVEEGSPADRYGIQIGDVLLRFNGETVLGVQQLGRLVRETPPGRKVKLEYWRNGDSGHLSLVVGLGKSFRCSDANANGAHGRSTLF